MHDRCIREREDGGVINLSRVMNFTYRGYMECGQSSYVCISFKWNCAEYQSEYGLYTCTGVALALIKEKVEVLGCQV